MEMNADRPGYIVSEAWEFVGEASEKSTEPRVTVGFPFKDATGDWECELRLTIDRTCIRRYGIGVTEFDALIYALCFLRIEAEAYARTNRGYFLNSRGAQPFCLTLIDVHKANERGQT